MDRTQATIPLDFRTQFTLPPKFTHQDLLLTGTGYYGAHIPVPDWH